MRSHRRPNGRTDNDTDVVVFDSIHHRFGNVVAVDHLDLTVRSGERLAILGRTGAGKSTVLNLLVGNLCPSVGTVRVDGRDPFAEHRELQAVIGMAFQTPRLLPWRTAEANVAVGQEILGIGKSQRIENARHWLDRMHLTDAYGRFPAELSGGMRQRVSLARAFAIDPALVLLDESFSALDEVTARSLRDDFLELADAERKTALIVTHNIEEAFAIAHRVIVLGQPAQILAEYRTATVAAVGSPEFVQLREEVRHLLTAPRDVDHAVSNTHTSQQSIK